jgi:hypothetical protein
VLVAVEGDDRHVAGDLRPDAEPAAVGLLVTADVEDVLVAGRDVQVVRRVVVQRVLVPQPCVQVPRVVEDPGIGEVDGVEVDGLRSRLGLDVKTGAHAATVTNAFVEETTAKSKVPSLTG